MPIRIVKCKIIGIVRDGKAVVPTVGSKFDFTAAEVAEIDKANPEALVKPVGDEALSTPKLTKAEEKAKAAAEAKEKADAEATTTGGDAGGTGGETGGETGTGEVL